MTETFSQTAGPRRDGDAARAAAPAPPPRPDNYAIGLRILRISPAWLLLSAVGFFLVVLTLSWLYQPATRPAADGARGADNHATNRGVVNHATNRGVAAQTSASASTSAAGEDGGGPAPTLILTGDEPPPALPEAGRFALQVSSHRNQSEANQHVSTLRAAGFAARVASVELPRRGVWHRVYVGDFETREEAARFGSELRAKGVVEAALVAEVD